MEYFIEDILITQTITEFENILSNINEFLAIETPKTI
jgi:hypothetical protein